MKALMQLKEQDTLLRDDEVVDMALDRLRDEDDDTLL